MRKTVILGGGLTGLSTGWKLSEDSDQSVEVLEIQDKLGGISSTFKHKEYLLDYGPHKIYTQMPEILETIKSLVGEELLLIPKRSKVRLKGKYFDFPLGLKSVVLGMNPLVSLKCVLGIGKTTLGNMIKKKEDVNYKDYVVNRFGEGLYGLVFEPYAKKVWGDPEKLSADLARTRIAIPGFFAMLKNMLLGTKNNPQVNADYFYYPKSGIIRLSEVIAKKIESENGKIRLRSETKKIELKGNSVDWVIYETQGKTFKIKADTLVSTIPIEKLVSLLYPYPPENVKKAAVSLKYRSLILVYVVLNKPRLFKDNWIFFPEEEFIFNRVSEQKGFSDFMIPSDKTVLTVEITCDTNSSMFKDSKEKVFKRVIKDLEKTGLIKESEVLDFFTAKLQNIYPVYDLNFKENMNIILEYLKSIKNLYTNGRQGLFNYNNMDHCIDMGMTLAEHIKNNGDKDEWNRKSKKFDAYKIVD